MMAAAKVPPKMSRAREEKLRAAWFGPYSLAVVARQNGLASWQAVRTFWLIEQAAGRLPAGDRAAYAHLAVVPLGEEISGEIIYCDLDDEPDDGFGARVPAGDPLLARLRVAHGHDVLRQCDDMPTQTLRLEVPYTPSAQRCREMRIAKDAWTAAQISARKAGVS